MEIVEKKLRNPLSIEEILDKIIEPLENVFEVWKNSKVSIIAPCFIGICIGISIFIYNILNINSEILKLIIAFGIFLFTYGFSAYSFRKEIYFFSFFRKKTQ